MNVHTRSNEESISPLKLALITGTTAFITQFRSPAINIALESIGRDLSGSIYLLQWTVISYALSFASFIFLGGKLCDSIGYKQTSIVGYCIFAAASLCCMLASNMLLLNMGWCWARVRCCTNFAFRFCHA